MSFLQSRIATLTGVALLATSTLVTAGSAGSSAASGPVPTVTSTVTGASTVINDLPVGLARLLATPRTGLVRTSGLVRGIATFGARPTAAQLTALREAGLVVQPMQALPLALVAGSVEDLTAAVTGGLARDVYPDERLAYHDTASSDVVSSTPRAARGLRARGFTGKGVTVGVIDSGCDATHPDLADRVTYNVTLASPEYLNQPADGSSTLVVPFHQTPYSNSDLGSGHGTHVAGIIAADSSSAGDGSALGVAPDAELACFGIGAVITTTAVVTAFDHVLARPDALGIDVINNSWGNSFRQFDPADPVNVASKAATRRGITVVFSAGNSGSGGAEASVSPFNQAPWVISVAASDLDRVRGDFSSNGLRFDNSRPVAIGEDGHTVAFGDRIGLVHPDISAPGVSVSSSCDSTGTVIGPCPGHGNTTASGTSMSGPHIAGAAAVLQQAQPRLSPAQVRRALQASASPVWSGTGADRRALPFWQVGWGHVNLDRAVRLVRGPGWRARLWRASRAADRRVLRSDGRRVLRSDLWQYDAPPVTVGGSDSATYTVRVGRAARELYLTLVYPTPGTAANLASYTAEVVDPSGEVVGTTTTDIGFSHGTATVRVPARDAGRYTVRVTGDRAVSDPDTIDSDSVNGRVVFVALAQLARGR